MTPENRIKELAAALRKTGPSQGSICEARNNEIAGYLDRLARIESAALPEKLREIEARTQAWRRERARGLDAQLVISAPRGFLASFRLANEDRFTLLDALRATQAERMAECDRANNLSDKLIVEHERANKLAADLAEMRGAVVARANELQMILEEKGHLGRQLAEERKNANLQIDELKQHLAIAREGCRKTEATTRAAVDGLKVERSAWQMRYAVLAFGADVAKRLNDPHAPSCLACDHPEHLLRAAEQSDPAEQDAFAVLLAKQLVQAQQEAQRFKAYHEAWRDSSGCDTAVSVAALLESLRAELAESHQRLVALKSWRHIESAPKDGTWILADRIGRAGPPSPCRYVVDAWSDAEDEPIIDPTHWMPLPPKKGPTP